MKKYFDGNDGGGGGGGKKPIPDFPSPDPT